MIAVDTSFLVAAFNLKDNLHRQAGPAWDDLIGGRWGRGLILEHVFLETVSVLKRKTNPMRAIQVGSQLLYSRELDFVMGSELLGLFWREFQVDLISPLSFVDTAVAVLARERAGGKVLTLNRAFRDMPGVKVEPST